MLSIGTCTVLMNIFYVDDDPVISAVQLCNKHIVKMPLETAQILSTAHRHLDGDDYADNHVVLSNIMSG